MLIDRIWRVTLKNLKSTFVRPIATAPMFPGVDNTTPPSNWKSLAPPPPLDSVTSVTAAAQNRLSRLPVPDLHETLAKLKESLKPLARSDEELKEAERKIDEFSQGVGKALQDRLLQRQNEKEHWLEEWWDNGAYMGYRDSVVVNVSYFYGFDPHPSHYPQTAMSRAAGLTRSALLFRRLYKNGLLLPEKNKEGPICMDTYRWMFDCCRIPGSNGLDWSVSHAKEGDVGDEGHIIVLRHGRVWKIEVSTKDTNGRRLLNMGELEMQFKYIYDNTEKDYPGVGVLTSTNRDTWAENYKTLVKSSLNKSILREIHSSAFVVCLDTSLPPHPSPHFSSPDTALSRILWHGNMHGTDLTNRWVDKPVQFIVTDNAEAGIMGEHSIMDGTPISRMCDNILDWLASPTFDSEESESSTKLPEPVALDWEVSPDLSKAIELAKKESRELCDTQSLQVLNTLGHGKAIAKKYGFSPDSWAQLIVQLAYSRLLKSLGLTRNGGTYEAASTRKFYKGRTETVRIVSTASDAWVSSMDKDDVNVEEKIKMFKEAAATHNRLAREAGNAKGCDRHLFGLKHLLKPNETLPALFDDPLYKRSSHWVLSTSAIFSKHFDAYGWGEVVPDGFGVAYMTGFDDRFMFTITSRTDMPLQRFCEEIQKAADDLLELFKSSEGDTIQNSKANRVDGQSQSRL